MNVFVINAGSSSIKLSLFDTGLDMPLFRCVFDRFGDRGCSACVFLNGKEEKKSYPFESPENVLENLPDILAEYNLPEFEAVGHRVVHGGEEFINTAVIDDETLKKIEGCIPLAPLHNPINIFGIKAARKHWGNKPQIAVFDTAFHHTMPPQAFTYALPEKWRKAGIRRYGFHGTSHKYIAMRTAEELGCDVRDLRIISCHLGNGASICAIDRGSCIDTSMGMTALEGLVMGTRSGDVDPGIFTFLDRNMGLSSAEVEDALYRQSGLKGLSGLGNDMRDIETKAAEGDEAAQLAIDVYAYRVRKYIGAYAAALEGVDAITFTGGIGENSATMRRRICDGLEFLGLHLDENKNAHLEKDSDFAAPQIHKPRSRIKVFVTKTREEWMIAKEVRHAIRKSDKIISAGGNVCIPVSMSARHVHLDRETLDALFGKGYELTELKKLVQPGTFAAEETVEIIGTKGSIDNVRILGPLRKHNQIEVSRTDTFTLGVKAPIRRSGDIKGTPVIRLKGPKGEVETNGLIIAKRHIHTTPEDAKKMGVKKGDLVDVRIDSDGRDTIFGDVLIRVSDKYVTEMHIDTDEANAAGMPPSTCGEIAYTPISATVKIVGKQNI